MQIEIPVAKTERAVLVFQNPYLLSAIAKSLCIVVLSFYLASCAVQQRTDADIKSLTKNLSPAISVLIKQADLKIAQRQWSAAISIIERALRINPKQAEIWSRMAIAHLGDNNAEQAIHMAKRSNIYAGKNTQLKSYNWRLMSRAYKILNNLDAAKSAVLKSEKIMQENN